MTSTELEHVQDADYEVLPARAPQTLFRSDDPKEIVVRASEVADALADVVKKQRLTTSISGRDHVRVEGWALLGTLLGVFPVCTWTKKLENGWEARVEARTLAGAVVGAAEAQCLRTESLWSKRDDYALRSMAQTRATSKALRQPLGFVMTLAGFAETPAEEMPSAPYEPPEPHRVTAAPAPRAPSPAARTTAPMAAPTFPVGTDADQPAASSPAAKAQQAQAKHTPPAAPGSAPSAAGGVFTFPSGKHQGKPLADVPQDYLLWYSEKGPREDVKKEIALFLREIAAGATVDEAIPFG